MIKPWLFEFFHAEHDAARRDDPAATQQRYQDYLNLWIDDDALGFEGIFFSEHHFGPGYSPSPNLVIAHLAAATQTIRLGVLGTVSPYATPWRVVEEFGMLDHLSKGRLEMGVVSGIPPELAVVGITPPQAAEIHAETMEVLLDAVRNRVVSHKGTQFAFDQVRFTPGFLQAAPAVWTAARSEASARKAGERGLKMCSGFTDVDKLLPVYEAYRDGAQSAGNPAGPDQLAVRRQVLLVEDETGVDAAARKLEADSKELLRFSAESLRIPDAPAAPLDRDELIAGTPDQVADEIIRQCRALGAGHFLASFNIFDTAELRTAHELFGRHVIPRLRAAEIG